MSNRRYRSIRAVWLMSTALGAPLVMAGPAAAQQPTVPSTGTSQASPGDGTPPDAALADIIVTAQRRAETLQRTPIAVSAVGGEELTKQSITQATQLSRLVPALQVAPASAFTQFYLRGVGTFGANAYSEQGVAFNLDGVYLSRPAAPAGLFYDLERIEVLKGPQGTLYGRNASGGAVNVITASPRLNDDSARLTGEVGNYGTIRGSGYLNIALGDEAALRISGQYVKRDGYFNDGYDDEDTQAIRAQLKLEPNQAFDLTLRADYAHVGGKGPGATLVHFAKGRLGPSDPAVVAAFVAVPPGPPVPQTVALDDGYQNNKFYGMSATANLNLGFATLTAIPAYRRTDIDSLNYSAGFPLSTKEVSEQASLELRLAGDTDRLKWVIGAYGFSETVKAQQFFDAGQTSSRLNSDLDTTSVAVFGQATYSLTDTFRVTGGARYTKDHKKQDTIATTGNFAGFAGTFPALTPIIASFTTNPRSDVSFKDPSWKVGLEYDLGPKSLLYASVATGFKGGILYSALGRNYSDPEKITAYTVGSKNRFFGNRLQFNVEGFYWKYTGQQISHLGPVQVATTPAGPIYSPVFVTENAGKSTIYGAEMELVYKVTSADMISLNYQYLKANYDSFQYQAYSATGAAPSVGCPFTLTSEIGANPGSQIYAIDCSGRQMVNAPVHTLNAAYQHRFDLGAHGSIVFDADTRIESSRFLAIEYLPDERQGSYMMSDAQLTYQTKDGHWSLAVFVNNIEDKTTYSIAVEHPTKNVVFNNLTPPRTYGVRVSKSF